jgi:general stress protein YciG
MTIEDWNNREIQLIARELAEGLLESVPFVEVFVFDSSEGPRGFSALLPETHAAICRKGGRNAHKMGVAHEFDSRSAKAAGRKGGHAVHAKLRDAREGKTNE